MEFLVADTPDPTKVTIYPMIESSGESVSFLDYQIPVASSVVLSEKEQFVLMASWRGLPQGVKTRCHIPKYLFCLEFPSGTLKATLCWKCNSIFIDRDGERMFYDFDGASGVAKELLGFVKDKCNPLNFK